MSPESAPFSSTWYQWTDRSRSFPDVALPASCPLTSSRPGRSEPWPGPLCWIDGHAPMRDPTVRSALGRPASLHAPRHLKSPAPRERSGPERLGGRSAVAAIDADAGAAKRPSLEPAGTARRLAPRAIAFVRWSRSIVTGPGRRRWRRQGGGGSRPCRRVARRGVQCARWMESGAPSDPAYQYGG